MYNLTTNTPYIVLFYLYSFVYGFQKTNLMSFIATTKNPQKPYLSEKNVKNARERKFTALTSQRIDPASILFWLAPCAALILERTLGNF